jgi:hypothetical protein
VASSTFNTFNTTNSITTTYAPFTTASKPTACSSKYGKYWIRSSSERLEDI